MNTPDEILEAALVNKCAIVPAETITQQEQNIAIADNRYMSALINGMANGFVLLTDLKTHIEIDKTR